MPEVIYTTNSSELSLIADAIREKTGGDSPLEFPDEFVQAIASISGEQWETLFEDEVTTESGQGGFSSRINYNKVISSDDIKVTFEGEEYTCQKIDMDGGYAYGGVVNGQPDFSEYPFIIVSGPGINIIYTETAGTYSLKIEAQESGGDSDLITLKLNVSSIYNSGKLGILTLENGAIVTKEVRTSGNCEIVYMYSSEFDEYSIEVRGSHHFASVSFSDEVNCEGSFDSNYPESFFIISNNPENSSITVAVEFIGSE